jgi:hypothetical protein
MELYIDCERCGERYHDEFIESYIREVERPDGGVDFVCIGCLDREKKEKKSGRDDRKAK